MINNITQIATQLKQMGVSEFSIKCNRANLDELKFQIANKFSMYGGEIPDMSKGIDMHIFGVRFKAKANSSKSRQYPYLG
jgi:hypothetical protein